MSRHSVTAVTIVSLAFLALAVVPAAAGIHCSTKIGVYGRSVMLPTPAPPYATTTANPCIQATEGSIADGSTLPPGTDQLFVRISGDFGATKPTIRIELTGYGFDQSSITLNRTASSMSGQSYDMREWLFMPLPRAGGELVVTAYYPAGPVSSTYRIAGSS